MLIKRSQTKKEIISERCFIREYEFRGKNVSVSTAFIDGRFPDKGAIANTGCEEIYYVLSGAGMIHSEFGDFNIEEGDLYHFRKGERYWSEGKNLKLVLVNSPKWSSDQVELKE